MSKIIDIKGSLKKLKKNKLPTSPKKALTLPDPLVRYLSEIRKYPLLSKEEETEIAKKYKETRDTKWAEILVTSNLRFVVKIAAEYSKFGVHMIDLIQEGNIGLMKAVKEFNPYKNVRLITYAVWWIKGYIQEYLMKQYSLVKIGTTQKQKKLFYQLQKQKQSFNFDEEGTSLLLSQKWNENEKDIQSMYQRLTKKDVSFDEISQKGLENSYTNFEPSHQKNVDVKLSELEELQKLKNHISKLRLHLSSKEIFILDNRLLSDEPLTLQEIGKKYETSREAVRQMEERLIKKIKKQMI